MVGDSNQKPYVGHSYGYFWSHTIKLMAYGYFLETHIIKLNIFICVFVLGSSSVRYQNERHSNPRCSVSGEKVSTETQTKKHMVRFI